MRIGFEAQNIGFFIQTYHIKIYYINGISTYLHYTYGDYNNYYLGDIGQVKDELELILKQAGL